MVLAMLVMLGATTPEKLAVMDVQAFDVELKPLAQQTQERLATGLATLDRFDVVTTSDVAAILGAERQRQLIGCADDGASCFAELMDALGAPWMATASLGRIGTSGKVRFDFRLISASTSTVVVRDGGDIRPEEMPALINQVVKNVQRTLGGEARRVETSSPVGPIVTLSIGAAVAITGVVGIVLLGNEKSAVQMNASMLSAKDIETFNDRLAWERPVFIATTVVGGLAAAGGLIWLLVQPKTVGVATGPMWLSPTPNGFAFGGPLP